MWKAVVGARPAKNSIEFNCVKRLHVHSNPYCMYKATKNESAICAKKLQSDAGLALACTSECTVHLKGLNNSKVESRWRNL